MVGLYGKGYDFVDGFTEKVRGRMTKHRRKVLWNSGYFTWLIQYVDKNGSGFLIEKSRLDLFLGQGCYVHSTFLLHILYEF